LARHREERSRQKRRWSWPALPQWRLVGGLGTAALTALLAVVLLSRGISADEITRRARISFSSIRNYACVFQSHGRYQGQLREFRQEQYYRKPGDFRLDTGQDYRLTTYVYADRVIHYLPGGDWKGKGPLVIVRPRREDESAIPFPFGVTWQNGGNVSLDQLIEQLSESGDAKLAGTEKVGDLACYRLQFTAVPPGGRQADEYEMWIDRESFLPRKVLWRHDADNEIVTEAQDLRINDPLLPKNTFEFEVPQNALVIEGDVDPHVFALPPAPESETRGETEPIALARRLAYSRSAGVPFQVFAPTWLPDGFDFVRVRRKLGRWLDQYWVRQRDSSSAQVLKLIQYDARNSEATPLPGATAINLGTRRKPIEARLLERKEPYPHVYLEWERDGTRCTLFGARVSAEELKRVARSLTRVEPERRVEVRSAGSGLSSRTTEPSTVPEETPASEPEQTVEATEANVPTQEPQPPMMPDMPDKEPMPSASHPQ
jgi:outer membrane lipoprotein-sorting protein